MFFYYLDSFSKFWDFYDLANSLFDYIISSVKLDIDF